MIRIPAGALRDITLPAYRLSEHLVTVAEYRAFLDEDGYDDPSYWSTPGWHWRLDQDIDSPRFWEDEAWATYLEDDKPIIGVSWYEADAYCSFRNRRLPSEQEWERGCRGDDDRNYPWGNEWRDDACSHRESGHRGTIRIGSFPGSISPWGLHDMVGNVWQWTSDRHAQNRHAQNHHAQGYVVRGGAWNNLPWSIGSAGRNAFPPTARFSNLGFRCADDGKA